MGSKAFVEGKTSLEGVEPDIIEFYKNTHYTSEKGWPSLEAKTHYNNMKDLKDPYTLRDSSMTIDEIVDTILGTKLGYIKGLGYGPKPNTTRSTKSRMAELEDSLKKEKHEVVSAQLELQNRLNAAETMVHNQQSQIEDQLSQIQDQQSQIQLLNCQLNTIVAHQEEIFRKMQLLSRSSPPSKDRGPSKCQLKTTYYKEGGTIHIDTTRPNIEVFDV